MDILILFVTSFFSLFFIIGLPFILIEKKKKENISYAVSNEFIDNDDNVVLQGSIRRLLIMHYYTKNFAKYLKLKLSNFPYNQILFIFDMPSCKVIRSSQ